MISAFCVMTTKPVLIIRAGEGTEKLLDPFDSSTVGTMEDDEYVTFEGMARDSVLGEHNEITSERLLKAIRAANEKTGRPVRFLRLGRAGAPPHWLYQISGVDDGEKIIMAKHHGLHPHPDTAKNADGSIDHAKAIAGQAAAVRNYLPGPNGEKAKITLLSMGEHTTDDGLVIFHSIGKINK